LGGKLVWSRRCRAVALVVAGALVGLALSRPATASAWDGMIVPTSGYVTTLFLDLSAHETWFPDYYDRNNRFQVAPAGGAHSGVDISAGLVDCQYPVYAAANGTVAWTGFDTGGFGWSVVIAHGANVGGAGHVAYTVYGHLGTVGLTAAASQSCVAAFSNQVVSAGHTIVGYQGSSGDATGTHVHWMILVGPTAPATVTSPYIPGFSPASPDFYTCLPLTAGDSGIPANQQVSLGQNACPAPPLPVPPRAYLPFVTVGGNPGW
jgi:murein DD-endopeptidase MepM/ murein hydrolase activator NlpD